MHKIHIQPTEKLYYKNMLLSECEATITAIENNFIVTDKTVSFPEGGGQEGDRGEIILKTGETIAFLDTRKRYGVPVYLDDFPTINIDTQICHYVSPEELEKVSNSILQGDKITIKINIERRERLTISHTASHLLYLGVGHVRPDALNHVIGCHIKEDSARFDFAVLERFSSEHISQISDYANRIALNDLPIELYPHKKNPDAWFWRCDQKEIPCGGTHLISTGNVKNLAVKRKNIGKGKDRIMCNFPDAILDLGKYI